eukprot:Gb_13695 [translate_table: standard]
MENMYTVAINDLPMEVYKVLCDLCKYKGAPNNSLTNEYSSYTNVTSGKEFLQVAKEVYFAQLKTEIYRSPFYSILIDESTDRTLEQHLIVYITYLTDAGRGTCATKFICLLKIKDEFHFVDKVANKVYAWLEKSPKRHGEMKELMELFQIGKLQVLQIHQIRWLSRGKVMERLVRIMPSLLKEWELQEKKLYEMATMF